MSMQPITASRRRFGRWTWVVAALLVASSWALGQESTEVPDSEWELRVCAQPNAYPMSSRDRPGFDNRIAEIIADELGAELTVHWTPFGDEQMLRTLHRGECDMVVGIGESVSGVVSTVPYLRAPYVFISRVDSGVEIDSLDDPELAELEVGTYQTGLPRLALRGRGLEGILREYAPLPGPSGPDRDTAILDAVQEGEVDLGIVYGPAAAVRVQEYPDLFRVVPVSPETDLSDEIIQLFRIRTIGVRPHDVVFRERVNDAMAARWDEIEAAIESYGVLGLSVRRPPSQPRLDEATVRIGLIIPAATREALPNRTIGEAARFGASLGDNYVARRSDRTEAPFDVLIASAPDDASAVRAAERMIATERVTAIAGGFNPTQAEELGRIAQERDVVFFNIGATSDGLRDATCAPTTFHVQASGAMYLDGILDWYAQDGAERYYLVVDEGLHGPELEAHFRHRVEAYPNGAEVAGVSVTTRSQFMFLNEIEEASASDADVVVLALAAEDEDQFLAQFDGRGIDAVVTSVPDLRTQDRTFLFRFLQSAPVASGHARPVLWDTTSSMHGADDINERYVSRTGEPMEATSWSAYAAVRILFAAAAAGAADDTATLTEWLASDETAFDLGKGSGVSFRSWDHQLRQPLTMIQIDPEAEWGSRVSRRMEFAAVVGVVPTSFDEDVAVESLDRLGRESGEGRCAP